jgi:hypothetical protein
MKSSPRRERWTTVVAFGSTVPIKDASKLSRRASVSVRHVIPAGQCAKSHSRRWSFMTPLWSFFLSVESAQHFLDLEDEEPARFELHWDRFFGSEYDACGDDERPFGV